MDMSRSIKRLALILILAIFVILVSKSLLTRAVKNLSNEAEKKLQAKPAPALPESAPAIDLYSLPPASETAEPAVQSVPLAIESSPAAE